MCEGSHSERAKVAISGFLALFLVVIVTSNVPLPGFRNAVGKVDDPVLNALGPRQIWNVFAPDPQGVVTKVAVRFVYADGSRRLWRIPLSGKLLGNYRDYRWLKLAENVARSDAAAQGLLLWAARTQAGPKPLARAELLRSVYDIAPIGTARSHHAQAQTYVLLTLRPGT